jgi:hypothetical protein
MRFFTPLRAFLAVLIVIQIFHSNTLYLRNEVIHAKLLVATALMAIARRSSFLILRTWATVPSGDGSLCWPWESLRGSFRKRSEIS